MSSFLGDKSLNLRVWHWLSSITIVGLLFTYIFRLSWFDKNDLANIIVTKLSDFNIVISNDDAISLAKLIRADMWQWHYIFGFILVFLIIFRLFAFFILKEKNPIQKIKTTNNSHIKFVKLAHAIFYVVTIYVCISGILIFFREDLGLTKSSLSLVKDLHEYSFWFYLFFIFSHIIGVVKAENSTDKGLISEMFSGNK
ncbi:hypothetical protein AAX26_01544 [Aliarcobacter thereius]|uniref:Cytochrome b561 bacterial/Ni-hydrogenase domain-containing protein n=2 Tax=Aliarcobacter thereius TaxID=544718 RepID=A0A1C0B6A0_9BACT|nr:cytochrome b/b6 domain-containing protein [Aliarcobacter thereius]OCL86411.1 hypothetical protein AAX26_01544 [Aliarcobacter thereius]OCL90096.1 hypothetical protein AAX25_01850 [Aliarcobacter thereius]OCL96304.1 hypothetical protein AA347_01795 [Aliarcobacter thereius LMG 24486]OCL98820.1 hypothetical protein AAX29_01330 [Aliarcobacter thereius]QBF15733.1 cytochrome b561 [Aliarcobacter thereius LMG 24486]